MLFIALIIGILGQKSSILCIVFLLLGKLRTEPLKLGILFKVFLDLCVIWGLKSRVIIELDITELLLLCRHIFEKGSDLACLSQFRASAVVEIVLCCLLLVSDPVACHVELLIKVEVSQLFVGLTLNFVFLLLDDLQSLGFFFLLLLFLSSLLLGAFIVTENFSVEFIIYGFADFSLLLEFLVCILHR